MELPLLGRWAGSLTLDAGRSPVPKSRGALTSQRPPPSSGMPPECEFKPSAALPAPPGLRAGARFALASARDRSLLPTLPGRNPVARAAGPEPIRPSRD